MFPKGILSFVTHLLPIMQLAIVKAGFACETNNCIGETQNCRFYEEIKINCHYDLSNFCVCEINSKVIPCNSFNFSSCKVPRPTTADHYHCADIENTITCTTDGYNFCNDCSKLKYTIWCFCNWPWPDGCQFCNISSTMATSTSFSPTGIMNTSLTSSSHGSVSASSLIGLTATSHNSRPSFINSLTITSKTSLVILTSTSTVAQVNTEALQVIAGVIPTVCILILGSFGLVVVVFVILHQRKSNKQMPVNQRGRTGTLQQMDNVYYAHVHTLQNNCEPQVMDEREAPPDYSLITLENFGTNEAHANTSNSTAADVPYVEADYDTLVHMNTRQITDNTQQDNNNYSTLSNNTDVATVTNQSAYEHVRDSHDPDYFDDLHVLQQIRAHKQ